MSSLLVVFLIVLLLPLFLSTWRTSLVGLSVQGLLMGWMAYQLAPRISAETGVVLIDLILVRGLVAPFLLYRVLRHHRAPRRNDVIPSNMLAWTLAAVLVVLAFRLASRITPIGGESQTQIAVATSGLLLGLFVLATQTGAFSQVVGALRIENAIALFEISADKPIAPLAVRVGQLLAFIATVSIYAWYVHRLQPTTVAEEPAEGPAL